MLPCVFGSALSSLFLSNHMDPYTFTVSSKTTNILIKFTCVNLLLSFRIYFSGHEINLPSVCLLSFRAAQDANPSCTILQCSRVYTFKLQTQTRTKSAAPNRRTNTVRSHQQGISKSWHIFSGAENAHV